MKLATDSFMQSSRVLMNVSQVALSNEVASSIFWNEKRQAVKLKRVAREEVKGYRTLTSGPHSFDAAVFTTCTCCIKRSQYSLNSDFLALSVSGLQSSEIEQGTYSQGVHIKETKTDVRATLTFVVSTKADNHKKTKCMVRGMGSNVTYRSLCCSWW